MIYPTPQIRRGRKFGMSLCVGHNASVIRLNKVAKSLLVTPLDLEAKNEVLQQLRGARTVCLFSLCLKNDPVDILRKEITLHPNDLYGA